MYGGTVTKAVPLFLNLETAQGNLLNFIFTIVISPFIIYLYIKEKKNYKNNYSNIYNTKIVINDNTYLISDTPLLLTLTFINSSVFAKILIVSIVNSLYPIVYDNVGTEDETSFIVSVCTK